MLRSEVPLRDLGVTAPYPPVRVLAEDDGVWRECLGGRGIKREKDGTGRCETGGG